MVKFNWRKKVAKALVFAMTMGTVGAHAWSTQVPVAVVMAANKTTVEINYAKYEATITATNSDRYLFLEVLKDESASKVTNTYVYEATNNKAVVDLSFLKATKEQYIRVYGDKGMDDPETYSAVVKIMPQPSKVAIKFVPGQTDLEKSFPAINPEEYEYKSLYGSSWTAMKDNSTTYDYATAAIAGTTLVIRKKAVDDQGKDSTKGAPAGVEVKVKIPASPKAPKIPVDYAKGTIKLPKGTEFKKSDANTGTEWVANSDAKVWTLKELAQAAGVNITESSTTIPAFTLLVRTKADKKAASVPAFVSLSATPEIMNTKDTANQNITAGTVSVKKDNAADSSRQLKYTSTTKGMELTATGIPFEYYDTAKSAWKAVAAGKTVVVPLTDQAKLKVRAAGVKATKTTEGAFGSYNEIELDACKLVPAQIVVTLDAQEYTGGNNVNASVSVKIIDGNKKEIAIPQGESVTYTVSGNGLTVSNGKIAIGSSTTEGEYTVTATFRDIQGTAKFTVKKPASN